jgi:hypothetical protein
LRSKTYTSTTVIMVSSSKPKLIIAKNRVLYRMTSNKHRNRMTEPSSLPCIITPPSSTFTSSFARSKSKGNKQRPQRKGTSVIKRRNPRKETGHGQAGSAVPMASSRLCHQHRLFLPGVEKTGISKSTG